MMTILNQILSRRSLIKELVLKDLKVRYCRPYLGFLWAFLAPFFTAVILYVVFSLFLKVRTEGVPFFLYLVSAVFAWGFFQESLLSSSPSLLQNKNLIRESSFPHYLIPVSIVAAKMISFLPSLAIVIGICLYVLKAVPLGILCLPLVLILHLGLTVGLSITASTLYVRWRDIQYLLEVALLFLFYLTPVVYPLSLVKNSLPRWLFLAYMLNPFVGLLNLYRACIIKGFYATMQGYVGIVTLIVIPAVCALFALFSGFYIYNKNKSRINDYLSY